MPADVEVARTVTPELARRPAAAVPQLSKSAPPDLAGGARRDRRRARPPRCSWRGSTGVIVGCLTLAVFRLPTGLRAWIEDVVVDDAARGHGVGEALNVAAIALAAERGARDRRPHLPAITRGGQPALPAPGVRAARDERLPLHGLNGGGASHGNVPATRSAGWAAR